MIFIGEGLKVSGRRLVKTWGTEPLFRVFDTIEGVCIDDLHFVSLDDFPADDHEGLVSRLREHSDVKDKTFVAIGSVARDLLLPGWSHEKGPSFGVKEGFRVYTLKKIGYLRTPQGKANGIDLYGRVLRTMFSYADGNDVDVPTEVLICSPGNHVEEMFAEIEKAGICAFDFETVGLEMYGAQSHTFKATLLSLSCQLGKSWVLPLHHAESTFRGPMLEGLLALLGVRFFGNADIVKVGHNVKFDMHCARWLGIESFNGRYEDNMLVAQLLDETQELGLKSMVARYLPSAAGYEEEVAGAKSQIGNLPLSTLSHYGAKDADYTMRIYRMLRPKLEEHEAWNRIYENISVPAVKTYFDAECNGMYIDKERLESSMQFADMCIAERERELRSFRQVQNYERSVNLQARADTESRLSSALNNERSVNRGSYAERELQASLFSAKSGKVSKGPAINFSSPKQVAELLYGERGFGYAKPLDSLSGVALTTTDKRHLSRMPDPHGFLKCFMLYKRLIHLKRTYLEGIAKRVSEDGRVHSTFVLTGTVSGRLSARNPNLQNMPNALRGGGEEEVAQVVASIKQCFVVPVGYALLSVDYSQADLRIMAEMARDDVMIDAYAKDGDLHTRTAAGLSGMSVDEFKKQAKDKIKESRQAAKGVNFGLLYGMGAARLKEYVLESYDLEMSLAEATDVRDKFFNLYSGLARYHKSIVKYAHEFSYVSTLLGRRRQLFHINDKGSERGASEERIALNSPVQGTVGELTLLASVLLSKELDPRCRFVNMVHDSLLYYVPVDLLNDVATTIKRVAENLPLKRLFNRELKHVKMRVDAVTSTDSWGALSE